MFIVFVIFTLARTSVILSKADELVSALTDYFKCEALGYVPGRCNRETFERLTLPYFSAIGDITLGLIPLSILNFVFKWSSVKKAKNKLAATLCRKAEVYQ